MGCWVAADSWLVFDEGLCGRDENRVGVQKLGGGEAGRGWITVGVNRVQDLSVGGGFLRVLLNPGPGDADESDNTTGPWSMRLYDLSDLSLVWQVGVPAHAAVTQNMSDSHTGYIVHDKEATADGAHPRRTIVLHLLSLKTGEATTVLSGIEYRLWGTRASYITPNSEILAVATCDNIRLFSIPSGGTLLSTVPIHQQQQNIPLQPPTTSPPQVHFAFSSVTNTLSIIDDSAAKSWKIRILSATAVELHEAITYGRTDVQATQLFGHHGDCIVLSPSEKGVQIDAVCYDGAVEYARRRVLPPPAGEEEQGAAMEVEVQMEVQPSRCRIPAVGMQLAGAVRDERWVVFKGSNEVANSDGHAAFWVVDFGSD
ncbi:hypothetical protein BZA05DRAFT_382841 [Tricharina praecox]|uniref:uncharacterized protein n=1 Tax=Tricharina praecox TaxID=43433 RepID=UPI0022202EA0|nr:uncharacterized protein BZA05DRAFT_382841 [Tricharina praecox]KAI5858943.1 hypothetical protein BZA05DRAFT_382841 [Tricharina praecox]